MTDVPRLTRATLDVLEVLLQDDDELYGLKIAQATGRPTGSIYPILARLEHLGWVESEWEQTEPAVRGARRRFYHLSQDGTARAHAALANRRRARPSGAVRPAPGFFPAPERP